MPLSCDVDISKIEQSVKDYIKLDARHGRQEKNQTRCRNKVKASILG